MAGLAIAFGLAALFGVLDYWIRRLLVREPEQMRRFLDRRFDVMRRKGFWGEERPFIDASMIKRWGHSGWLLIPLPAFNLSMDLSDWWGLGGLASFALLVFAGTFFGDSRAGVHFLRVLGVDQYQRQAEQGAAGQPATTPRVGD